VDDDLRAQLLALLTSDEFAPEPPASHGWQRSTVDDAQHPSVTWGLCTERLQALTAATPVIELNSRLTMFYGEESRWYHMPSSLIQAASRALLANSCPSHHAPGAHLITTAIQQVPSFSRTAVAQHGQLAVVYMCPSCACQ
jgi:hypothetical protein